MEIKDQEAYVSNPVIERIYMDRTEGLRPETIRNHVNRYKMAASYIQDGESVVLDLCCGSGYGTDILQREKPLKIIGIDSSREAIEYAQVHYPACDFLQEDIIKLFTDPTERNKLPQPDIVVFYEAIEHLKKTDCQAIFDAIGKLLKPDGLLFISTPRDIRVDRNPDHIKQWEYDELQSELKKRFHRVDMLGQDWASGEFVRESPENASYFIAVCGEPRQV